MYLTLTLHVCAVLICIFYIAWRFRVTFVEAAPVFVCGLVLTLYVLAIGRCLSWIDGIAALSVVLFAVWFVRQKKEGRSAFITMCRGNMTHPSFITAAGLLTVIAVCTYGKVVTWWDDINFWATDAKALYFLDGFAGKYGNAAPEFGDYPPGAQLMKWWFLHLNPQEFCEGLAFIGYYTMNVVFLLPLLKRLKGRNVPVMFFTAAAFWFVPSIAEVYGYEGFCADLTMACIYGGFLLAVTDRQDKADIFYYGRLALYLGVLVLVKSVGFVWAMFGLVFLFFYQRSAQGGKAGSYKAYDDGGGSDRTASDNVSGDRTGSYRAYDDGAGSNRAYNDRTDRAGVQSQSCPKAVWGRDRRNAGYAGGSALKGVILTAALPMLTGGSWLAFCLLMRRVTKTTATAVKYMTTDEYGISGYTQEFARAFAQAFYGLPLHKERGIGIDLTPLGIYLCICAFVILFYKKRILPEKTGKIILWFSMVSGLIFYAIIFVAHITIFATETQYLEASGMISSIERYGAPFTIGTLVFLAGIWLEGGDRLFASDKYPAFLRTYGTYLCFILFVGLTAGYQAGYHGLLGYRSDLDVKKQEREMMIGADETQFVDAVQALGRDGSARVCYIRRGDALRWVNNSYLNYEVSPVSVVYRSVNLDDAPTDWMVQEIRASHADYLYVEETESDTGAVFDGMVSGEEFICGVLYLIDDNGMSMELTRVSQ